MTFDFIKLINLEVEIFFNFFEIKESDFLNFFCKIEEIDPFFF